MARSARRVDASAPAERLDKATFTHAASGFRYRVSSSFVMEFDQTAGGLGGAKALAYAVGSGTRAFSYLLEDGGFLYEAPVAYYATGKSWGLAPGYDRYSYPYLTRPIAPGCLACHASGVQATPMTLNRYGSPAFLEGGVACERCHGDGAKHVAAMRSGDAAGGTQIVNPAKLTAERRDSICAQCHLTGDVRVMKEGSDWRSFQPGARLSDHQTVFVRAQRASAMQVTGHVENLALSACERKSGGRLWCGSCHDAHAVPAPAEASAWFRGRCLTCHETRPCTETKAKRMQAKDDCTGCHMPKRPASDAEHVVMTDHSIPRRPQKAANAVAADAELAPFGGGSAAPRDLALAYAIKAVGHNAGSDHARAVSMLERVVRERPDDVEVLLYLAEIYRNGNQNDWARPLYERAIRLDPGQVTASVGLGGVMMERGDYAEAIRLWTDALSKNSGLELVRMNLALAQWKAGERAAAEANLKKAISLNPAFAPARDLLEKLTHPAR
jgi:hypothetical protein